MKNPGLINPDFSEKQQAVLIGSMLGDGHLQKSRTKVGTVRLRVSHKANQGKAVDFIRSHFINYCKTVKPAHDFIDHGFPARGFYTSYTKELIPYHDYFYELQTKEKIGTSFKKIVRPDIGLYLTSPLSLAIWYADDGTKRSDCDAARIATQGFSFEENALLAQCLKENFDVKVEVESWKQGGKPLYGLTLKATGNHFAEFRSLIKDIIVNDLPMFTYKL